MKAILKTYRQSPRKARLIADLIRGKSISAAKDLLEFTIKRSSPIFEKLLDSAVANAVTNSSADKDTLFIKEITVNKGVVMKRSMPRARGSAYPIKKRTSHIVIILGVRAQDESKKSKVSKAKKEIKNPKKALSPKLAAKS